MGGNASKEEGIVSSKEKLLSFAEKKEIFNSEHEKFRNNLLENNIIEDINTNSDPTKATIQQLNDFINKYNSKAKKAKITDLKNLIVQLTTETFISQNLITKNFDVFDKMQKVYRSLDLNENELLKIKKVEERFQKEFETKLLLVDYNLDTKLKKLKELQLLGVNSNLKFNPEFQPDILNLNLSHALLSNKVIGEDIAELIENCPKLQIVNFIVNPTDDNGALLENFGLDGRNFQVLYKLFKAVSNNKYIKSFFFHSVKDYQIIIPPEISTLIINKLQSETLIAFHLGNINLSIEFMKKFFFQIVSTRSMLFLSMENKIIVKMAFDYLVKVLAKNNSIMALSLTGNELKDYKTKISNFKEELYGDVTPIDVVYFGEKSIVSIVKEEPPKN